MFLGVIERVMDEWFINVRFWFCMETKKFLYLPKQNMEYGQVQSRYSG